VSCLAVLNDCTLASGSFDKTIRIWDLNNGCSLNVLRGHSGIVMSLALLSNGSLASSSEYIRIWDIMSGETIKVLNGHTEKVKCLIALKNGGLASGSYDRSIVIHL
jgi:WD40 repeat protein